MYRKTVHNNIKAIIMPKFLINCITSCYSYRLRVIFQILENNSKNYLILDLLKDDR